MRIFLSNFCFFCVFQIKFQTMFCLLNNFVFKSAVLTKVNGMAFGLHREIERSILFAVGVQVVSHAEFVYSLHYAKRPSIKDVRTNSQKKLPSPPCPQNVRTSSPPPLSCGHTLNFKKSENFLHQKVQTSASEEPLVRTRQTRLPLTAGVFYGQPKGVYFNDLSGLYSWHNLPW